ncbi:hypothetical protein NEMBOFW57_000324 [Staphylotrichum longicolle]|uniref:Uncharacterized protein n=1 Tax=Staphylotrichum longicolle TaxID=669026 RepID=A0AAD4EZE6_9PEZI|nr:hypothetical protein NEMBOFW57_000324 [Staphylotrichum longicolle]
MNYILTHPQTVESLKRWAHFNPRIALLGSAVQQLKCVPPTSSLQHLWAFATTALLVANDIDSRHDPAKELDQEYIMLLTALDSTMQYHHENSQKGSNGQYLETRLQDPHGIVGLEDRGRESKRIAEMHWSNFHFDPACFHQRSWQDSFLSLAIQFGLCNYVKAELGKGNSAGKVLRSKKGRPLLDYALVPSTIAPYHLAKPRLVKTLLDHGADPNAKFEKRTCWERALQWQHESYASAASEGGGWTLDEARGRAEERIEIFQLLVSRHADVRSFIVTAKGRRVSARSVLDESFRPWLNEAPLKGLETLLASFPKDDEQRRRGTFSFSVGKI